MFKKSIKLCCEKNTENSFKNLSTSYVADLNKLPVSKNIINTHKSNKDILDDVVYPYELRGEYIPRRKINPFKRKPMEVIYDQSQFRNFVLPSKREITYGFFDLEKLFGIKRWRNDSPMMKEYIKIDNQVIVLLTILVVIYTFHYKMKSEEKTERQKKMLLSDKAVFSYSDLI